MNLLPNSKLPAVYLHTHLLGLVHVPGRAAKCTCEDEHPEGPATEGLDEKAYSREEGRHVVGPVMPAYNVESSVQHPLPGLEVPEQATKGLRGLFGLRRQVFGLGFL